MNFAASVGEDSPVRTVDRPGRFAGLPKQRDLPLEFVREPLVVAVLERNQLAPRRSEAGVARGAAAAVVLVPEVAYSRIAKPTHELFGSVGRRIVDHEQVQRAVGLL